MNKMPEFDAIFARKILFFPEFWEAIPGYKAESEQTRPQQDHGGHDSTDAIVLNKLFMHLLTDLTLLYCTSLDT